MSGPYAVGDRVRFVGSAPDSLTGVVVGHDEPFIRVQFPGRDEPDDVNPAATPLDVIPAERPPTPSPLSVVPDPPALSSVEIPGGLVMPDGSRLTYTWRYDPVLLGQLADLEMGRLAARTAAQEAHRALLRPRAEPFDADLLVDLVARPAPPPMRVEGLIPSEASTLVSAQRKTGKTTFALNLARCLLTGEPLLGRFDVRRLDGRVALLNYEVSGAQIGRWADEVGVPGDRLLVVNLRGRRNPLGDPEDRERLAALLRANEVETLLVDPFGRAYTGASQNDSGEVGAYLVGLDAFARVEAGVTDLVLTAHAGWNGERTRGASALEDWADAVVMLTNGTGDDEGTRYLRAFGRDVDVEEDRLGYDPGARLLTLTGEGSRRRAASNDKAARLAVLVVRVARAIPGVTGSEMVKQVRALPDAPSFQDADVRAAAKYAVEHGQLRIEAGGPGRPSHHYALDPGNPVQPRPDPVHGRTPTTPSTPSIDGRGGGGRGGEGGPRPVDEVQRGRREP